MAAADFRSTIRTTITPFFSKHIPSTTRHSHYSFSSTYSPKPLLSHHHRLTMPPVAIDGKQTVDVDVDDSCSSSVTVKPPSLHDYHRFDQQLLDNVAYDALVWASLHGLVMGDKSSKKSGTVPGVGLVHAPFALLPVSLPETKFKQACDLAPIFNELVDRVSLDANFLQESLSRTKKVDEFTSRLLDIHSKMLHVNKKEEIRLGLHRSDYMLDEQTKSLLQIELNTISSSFAGFGSLVTELHRYILSRHGKLLGLDAENVPVNNAVSQNAEGLAKAWIEYNNPKAVIMFVVQAEERNMYDQHSLSAVLKEKHGITIVRKTLAEVDQEGEILPDGTLTVNGQAVAVVYFRAGYTPADYPSESEWRARLLMEQSSAVKCPSISYHLVGTKKIQQELAKPGVLERFLENKDDIAKMRECFAGLWSLDDSDIVKKAIEKPEIFVMKPQREGGGNNIYGDAVRETLIKLQNLGSQEDAAYILMQRIFPNLSAALLMRNGYLHKDHAISELGIFGTYLRNKDKVIINNQSGYLMRTKIASSDEGGVAAGFAVLDSVYLS
ncbi:glutathione synthetase, chloroplastic [Lathyrus oleraceus]|uniref:Glutathione synthetase n=1 Tax=Pisum sativum TaxID=3888 RepID=A0A9D4XMW1_PEA|nr:glutathione synthetase, chloroplastic-like [Pisum sativum]KAI5424258.1 Glutathione synthetase [Pisum sativum]